MKLRVSSQSCDPFDIEPAGEEIFVGRSSSCDLVIPHQGISRRHVRIFHLDDVWMIQDLGSTNATYLGDLRLGDEPQELKVGEVIRLAPSKSDYVISVLSSTGSSFFPEPGTQTVTHLASSLLHEMHSPLVENSGSDVLRHHAQRLLMLSQANGKLSRASDREDLAERLLDQLFTFLEPDAAVIYLDGGDEGYNVFAQRPKLMRMPPLSQTLIKELTGPGMAVYANDLSKHQALAQSHSLAGSNLHALVASPLFEEDKIYGIAVVYSFNMATSFDDSHMKLLVGLAATASMRLHNIILTEEAARLLQESNRRLEDMVAERTRELRQKTMHIISSLDYARHIQEAILPRAARLREMFSDAFVIHMPRDIVSGDFFWCGWQGNQALVALVDCTGHGVPGAFMSMIGFTLLNKIINEQKISDPSEILKRLNDEVRVALRQEDTTIRAADGMEMGLCKVDLDAKTLSFAGARFDLYWTKAGKPLEILKGNRQSIGGKQRRGFTGFANQTINIESDDSFFMFTDGFADQRDMGSMRFGKSKLKQIMQTMTDQKSTMEVIRTGLLEALVDHRCGSIQRDDISALGFNIGQKTPPIHVL